MSYNPDLHHRRSIRLKGYDYSQAGSYFVTLCCQDKICRFGVIKNEKMILNDAGKMVEKWYKELTNKFPDIEPAEFIIMPNHFHCIITNTGMAAVGADLCVCPNDKYIPDNHIPVLGEHIGSPLHGNDDLILGEHIGSPLHHGNDNSILGEHIGSPLHHENDDFILGEHMGSPLHHGNDNSILGEHIDSPLHHGNDDSVLGEHIGSPLHHGNDDSVLGEHIGSPLHHGNDDSVLGEHIGSPLHAVVQWFKTMTTNEYIRGVKTLNWEPFNKKLWQRNYWEHIIRNDRAHQNISDYIKNNPSKWRDDLLYSE